jgi:GlpG protein
MPEIDFRRTPVTILLAIAIIALEAVCTLDPARRFYYYDTMRLGISPGVWRGQLWQPFTTTLLHGSLLHAAFNVWWLWVFGQFLEPRLGSPRFLALTVLLAYTSSLPQFLWGYYSQGFGGMVGFSGVVYGLFGWLWMGSRQDPAFRAVCNAGTVKVMLIWFVLCILMTQAHMMLVGNLAHGAGLVFGVLFGLAAYGRNYRRAWQIMAGFATLVVLASMVIHPAG